MNDEFEQLVGAYAVDALDDAERARFEAYLAAHPHARREVDDLRVAAASLAVAAAEDPPPSLRDRVLSQVARTPQLDASPSPSAGEDVRSTRSRRRRWPRAIAAAAAVAALAIGAVAIVESSQRADDAERLAEVLGDPRARVVDFDTGDDEVIRLVWSPDHGDAVLVGAGFGAIPPHRAYELWLVQGDRARPSALFRPDEDGRVELRFGLDLDLDAIDALAVTEEPAAGSSRPTGELIGEASL